MPLPTRPCSRCSPHFVRRIVEFVVSFPLHHVNEAFSCDVLWMDTSRPMLAARSRTMTRSRCSRILTEPRLQCRCCQVCPSDNKLLLLCHRNTPAAQFSRLGEVHHRRDTSPQVNNNKVVQVASALTTCVGLHPSVLEGISRAGEKYRTIVTTASVP